MSIAEREFVTKCAFVSEDQQTNLVLMLAGWTINFQAFPLKQSILLVTNKTKRLSTGPKIMIQPTTSLAS